MSNKTFQPYVCMSAHKNNFHVEHGVTRLGFCEIP